MTPPGFCGTSVCSFWLDSALTSLTSLSHACALFCPLHGDRKGSCMSHTSSSEASVLCTGLSCLGTQWRCCLGSYPCLHLCLLYPVPLCRMCPWLSSTQYTPPFRIRTCHMALRMIFSSSLRGKTSPQADYMLGPIGG